MSAPDSGAKRRTDSVHPSAPDDTYESWVGRVIDERYRIDGLLGEGGMGAVFEAEHLKLRKRVALKVIHPEFAGDGEVAKRFVREAMASAQLEHPHVASATDYGTLEEGGAYLVMPLVRGNSLRDELEQKGSLGWIRACEIGGQIADALSSAHKAGIVHRDLKPDNVMLEPRDDGSDRVLVLDFGIARVADEKIAASGQALTRVGTVIGTPGYMAPEQALGEPVDFRVDLYALGLLIYEMVRGERLFDVEDLTAIVTLQLTETAPRLSSGAVEVPEELDSLVASMLTKDRDARPQSAGEVREMLQKLVLSATLHRVTSGEHSLPDVGPVTGPFQVEKAAAPTPRAKSAVAPTMMAAPKKRSAKEAAPSFVVALPERARELVKRARALPPAVLAAGAAGVGMFGLSVLIAGGALVFGGGDDPTKQEMVQAVVQPVEETPEPEPEPEPEPLPQSIPQELAQAYSDVNIAERSQTRRRAAQAILDYEPREAIPGFLFSVASIESTSRCQRRREHVVLLGELGDTRALPVLERLDATPRNRCGNFFRRTDCLRCLREDLAVTLGQLRPQ